MPSDRLAQRIARCVFGLALFGPGIACIIAAELGAAPWDVFHQGVSELTGIPIGTVIVITGALLLLAWIPLHERPGPGTLINALEIGLVVDLVLPHLPATDALVPRVVMFVVGLLAVAVGSGIYIGAGLGPGPRDGLMTGLARRGMSLRLARTGIELTVLVAGLALGATAGIGTAVFAFGIGPLVHVMLPRLRMREPEELRVVAVRQYGEA
jgi:uncharacterized membrane protein YczE